MQNQASPCVASRSPKWALPTLKCSKPFEIT
jgi:hypothetical protein